MFRIISLLKCILNNNRQRAFELSSPKTADFTFKVSRFECGIKGILASQFDSSPVLVCYNQSNGNPCCDCDLTMQTDAALSVCPRRRRFVWNTTNTSSWSWRVSVPLWYAAAAPPPKRPRLSGCCRSGRASSPVLSVRSQRKRTSLRYDLTWALKRQTTKFYFSYCASGKYSQSFTFSLFFFSEEGCSKIDLFHTQLSLFLRVKKKVKHCLYLSFLQ